MRLCCYEGRFQHSLKPSPLCVLKVDYCPIKIYRYKYPTKCLPANCDVNNTEMDTTGEEGAGQGLEREKNPEEAVVERKTDDEKATYKSYKYDSLGECDIFPTFQDSLRHRPTTRQSQTTTANMSSIRKKYRKMRMKFDEKMRESNSIVTAEALAEETAKRLAIENEFVPLPHPLHRQQTNCLPAVCSTSSST